MDSNGQDKPTRSDCFLMVGRLTAIASILRELDVPGYAAEQVEVAGKMLGRLAPPYNEQGE